jgi:hypothetical protein
MNTEAAYQLETEPDVRRDVSEQIRVNHLAVEHAANETLAQATHPARWQRRGLFRRLARRDPG